MIYLALPVLLIIGLLVLLALADVMGADDPNIEYMDRYLEDRDK